MFHTLLPLVCLHTLLCMLYSLVVGLVGARVVASLAIIEEKQGVENKPT